MSISEMVFQPYVPAISTTDDIVILDAAHGLVLKDAQVTPHYWRLTVSVLGVLVTTDIGITPP